MNRIACLTWLLLGASLVFVLPAAMRRSDRPVQHAEPRGEPALWLDVDQDGDLDRVETFPESDAILCIESDGATPPRWTTRAVTLASGGAHRLRAADVDGDGDLDLLAFSDRADRARVFLNARGRWTAAPSEAAASALANSWNEER